MYTMYDDLYVLIEERSRSRTRFKSTINRRRSESGFQCIHCRGYVCEEPLLSGVQNRNHCPYCLWSRHLDLFQAGDRLAACKEKMQPIGLTLKRTRKKYGAAAFGELMLIHRCIECGKVALNRIAADDDARTVFKLYESSLALEGTTKTQLDLSGIHILDGADIEVVRSQLFGKR